MACSSRRRIPNACSALVLYGDYAKRIWSPDYPWAPTREERRARAPSCSSATGAARWTSASYAPSALGDPALAQRIATLLPAQRQPGRGGRAQPHEHRDRRARTSCRRSRSDARRAPGRRSRRRGRGRPVDCRADPRSAASSSSAATSICSRSATSTLLDEVEAFLTGVRRGPEPERVLATVLFTDVVGSTETAVAPGRPALARTARAAPPARAPASWSASRRRGGHGRRRFLRDVRRAGARDPLRLSRFATRLRALGLEHPCGGAHRRVRARRGRVSRGIAVDIGARVASGQGEAGQVLASRAP